MNWITLYIKGRSDFREDVLKKLEQSRLDIMPGYMDASLGRGFYDLYWVNDSVSLREIKEAVGGKLVWKHRLRFFLTLDEFLQAQNIQVDNSFTEEEQSMLDAVRRSA